MNEAEKRNTLKGYILVVLSACAFGTMGIANRFAYNHGADMASLMSMRFMVVTVFYIIYMRFRGLSWRLPFKKVLVLVMLGLVLYANVVFFFYRAVEFISPAMASLILYTYPAMVGILGHFFLGERLTGRHLVSLAVVMLGCGLIVSGPMNTLAGRGLLYAFLTALFYAVYIIGNRKILSDIHPVVSAAYMGASCAVYFLVFQLLQGGFTFSFDIGGWIAMLVLAFWCTIAGILAFFHGMMILGATKASIVSTFEPLFTALLAWIILGDVIGHLQWIGGICILAGVLLLRIRGRSERKGKNEFINT